MKVLHITNNYPTKRFPIFGIFVKEQIESLKANGVSCEVFFINGREQGRRAYWSSVVNLRKLLKKGGDYDLLHCHHSFSALILLLTFRSFRYPKVLSYQNDPEREGGSKLFSVVYRFFDSIILKNNNNSKAKLDKVKYLPNGVNIDFFKPYDQLESKERVNLDESKSYILFMDSYNRRTQKRIDRYEKVMEILKEKDFDIEPLVLTNTERSEIPYYMSASALHILTSDFEGSPNSVKECLACDVPVVTTPVGNVKDMLMSIEGCYISQTFDPEELAELVLKSLKYNSFSGRDFIINNKLDLENVAKKLVSHYKLILKKRDRHEQA